MTGPLKRKFDQLEEDSSFSSPASSGCPSHSCSLSFSVSPAWDSAERSPWSPTPPPARAIYGPQSFTRECSPWDLHHPLSFCLKTEVRRPLEGQVCSCGYSAMTEW